MSDNSALEVRVGVLEDKLKEDYATRNHVHEAVTHALTPFNESVSKLEKAVDKLSDSVGGIRDGQNEIKASHNKLLEDRSANERAETAAKIALLQAEKEELKNNTFVKRYGSGITVGVGATVLIKFLLDVLVPLMTTYQALPKK